MKKQCTFQPFVFILLAVFLLSACQSGAPAATVTPPPTVLEAMEEGNTVQVTVAP